MPSGLTFGTGNAKRIPGGGVRFDERGGNVMAHSVMAQWQSGELVPVWPEDSAVKPFVWAGKPVKQ